ncbi:MAG: cytochrome P450 [Anaerolineae bacterium]|jgi:cytochrome P450|nr:cytochrome P450 [Anaerolineae bacterium]
MTVDAPAPVALPAGPAGLPVIGNLLQMQRHGMLDFYRKLWEDCGDIATASIGPMKFLMVTRPEHIQHVLVKNAHKYTKGLSHDKLRLAIGNGILTLEGDVWSRQRKLMQPTFTPRGIKPFADIMIDETQGLIERWNALPQNAQIDISQEMQRVTMKVISRSMFGLDMDRDFKGASEALVALLEYTSASSTGLIDIPLFVPTPTNRRLKEAKRELRDFLMGIIKKRREEGLQEDLLSMLMTAKDADTGEFMTDEQLHDEALIIFFAGHETTASLLTWTSYLMSNNFVVERKLHRELAEVLGGRGPRLEDIPNLPYTRMVLDEALRLYSPVPIVARDLQEDDELAGYQIPKGTLAVVALYNTHRHPEFWERPLEFYPEHFAPEAVEKRPRYAYAPFGAGPRICIGLHFAQMEAVLILADIAQRFRLRLARPHDGSVRYVGVTRPSTPILMTVEKRLDA